MPLLFTPHPPIRSYFLQSPASRTRCARFPDTLQAESSELLQIVWRVWADILAFCLVQRKKGNSGDHFPQRRCRWQQSLAPWWWYMVWRCSHRWQVDILLVLCMQWTVEKLSRNGPGLRRGYCRDTLPTCSRVQFAPKKTWERQRCVCCIDDMQIGTDGGENYNLGILCTIYVKFPCRLEGPMCFLPSRRQCCSTLLLTQCFCL